MLTYLHDIRNKLTLISGQTSILSKKYGEDDFVSIRTNLVRISELINDAYRHLKSETENRLLSFSSDEFMCKMDLLTEAAGLLFPVTIQNEICEYKAQNLFSLEINIGKVFQVIENAIDNSVKAGARKVIIRLLETREHCIYEIVDNGTEKSTTMPEYSMEVSSLIPHGLGKEIMINNMMGIGGKVEWTRRLDYSGMIVRLYFPKKS
ncbi:MAG: hypothetical protein H7336_10040 [Bacteriovorax sp.]|nr:hypothetical protein [Bacteriovorax sp.]